MRGASVLALGIEDEGRPRIAQQMRDNQRRALAAPRAGHDEDVLVRVQKQRLAVIVTEGRADLRCGCRNLNASVGASALAEEDAPQL